MSFHHLSCNITSQHYTSHTFSHHSCTQGSKHNFTQPIDIDQCTSVMQQIYQDSILYAMWYHVSEKPHRALRST